MLGAGRGTNTSIGGYSGSKDRRPALAALAEFERARIQERVRAGLARAKAQGVRLGRPPRRVDPERLASVAGLPVREAARRLGVPRSTLQRCLATPDGQIGFAD